MAELIQGSDISDAWLSSIEHLLRCGRVDINLAVAIAEPGKENAAVRRALDKYLKSKKYQAVQTVANTIFPEKFYIRRLGDAARQHLYESHNEVKDVVGRLRANWFGTYIGRLIDWPGSEEGINQLEETVRKLQKELSRPNPMSSIYELSLSPVRKLSTESSGDAVEPNGEVFTEDRGSFNDEDALEMHIYSPGKDKRPMGFPCLSFISLTLAKRRLNMTAVYRNQYFVQKAYGNYLGLSRLLDFLCQESGCEPGEILCVATHAYLEDGPHKLQHLLEECRRSSQSQNGNRNQEDGLHRPRLVRPG